MGRLIVVSNRVQAPDDAGGGSTGGLAMALAAALREHSGLWFGWSGRTVEAFTGEVDIRRVGALKEGEETIGQRVRCKIVKNKVAPPFRVAEFDMMHTNGISYEGDILDLAVTHKIVGRTGAWFKYGEEYIGQGKEKARVFLQENPQLAEEIRGKVLDAVNAGDAPVAAEKADVEDKESGEDF